MQNKIEINKFLTKAVGECYHEFDRDHRRSGYIWKCIHCEDEYLTQQRNTANKDNNFFNEKGFFKLWNWAQTQEWFFNFIGEEDSDDSYDIINPEKFAIATYEYLKDK